MVRFMYNNTHILDMGKFILYSANAKGFLVTVRQHDDNVIDEIELTDDINKALRFDTIGDAMRTSSHIYTTLLHGDWKQQKTELYLFNVFQIEA